jgi:hypothetical protein
VLATRTKAVGKARAIQLVERREISRRTFVEISSRLLALSTSIGAFQ